MQAIHQGVMDLDGEGKERLTVLFKEFAERDFGNGLLAPQVPRVCKARKR